MPMIRICVTGQRGGADALVNVLHGIEGIEHVEEIDDLYPGIRDDSSSAALIDDDEGSIYRIEVMAPNARHEFAVREIVRLKAEQLDLGVEFVDRF